MGLIDQSSQVPPTAVPLDATYCTPVPKYTITKTTIGLIVLGLMVAFGLVLYIAMRIRRARKAKQAREKAEKVAAEMLQRQRQNEVPSELNSNTLRDFRWW